MGYIDIAKWLSVNSDGFITNTGYVNQGLPYLQIGQRRNVPGIADLQLRGFLFFNTLLLGEGIKVRSAKLYVNIETMAWERIEYNKLSNFELLRGKWKGDYPADYYPSGTLDAVKDFDIANYQTGNCMVVNNNPLVSGWNEITLNALGRAWVTGERNTKFMLRHKENNQYGYIQIYSREKGIADCMFLTLEYGLQAGVTKRLFIRPAGCSKGDIFYYDGDKVVRLPVGTENQELEINAEGLPEWRTI